MRFLGTTCAALLLTATVATPAWADAAELFEEKPQPEATQTTTVQEQVFQDSWTKLINRGKTGASAVAPFRAQVVLTSSAGVTVLEADQVSTLAAFLATQKVDLQDYHTDTGKPLNAKTKLQNNKTIFLFKLEYTSTFEKITLSPPVERVESASMPVGTEVVMDEGTEGIALKTIVAESDLSAVKKLNRKALKRKAMRPIEVETLTVVTAPTPKVILVGTATEELSEDSLPTEVGPSNLIFPVEGPITSEFGMRVHPITGIYKLHDGTDFGVPCGLEVHAVTGGTVTTAKSLTGYGNQVEIDHGGGFVTSYSHLNAFAVEVGDVVKPGQTVGLVGSTGYSTGCHLHFMTIIDGEPTDPMEILNNE